MVYFYVGIGGAIGSLLRYFLSQIGLPMWSEIPIGTLLVNLLGSFLLGWFVAKIVPMASISLELKTGISTGIIGSFTTFSTLSIEVIQLLNLYGWGGLIYYLSISLIGGLGLVALGYLWGSRKFIEVNSP